MVEKRALVVLLSAYEGNAVFGNGRAEGRGARSVCVRVRVVRRRLPSAARRRGRAGVGGAFLGGRDLVQRVAFQPVVGHVGRGVPRSSGARRRGRAVLREAAARVAYGGHAGRLAPYGRLDRVHQPGESRGRLLYGAHA